MIYKICDAQYLHHECSAKSTAIAFKCLETTTSGLHSVMTNARTQYSSTINKGTVICTYAKNRYVYSKLYAIPMSFHLKIWLIISHLCT